MHEKYIYNNGDLFFPQCCLGIDECGRGCVIGPLIISGVIWEKEKYHSLTDLGVKDSKQFQTEKQKGKRNWIAKEVQNRAKKIIIEAIQPAMIDHALKEQRKAKNKQMAVNRKRFNLNILEIQVIADIIANNPCSEIFIDSLATPRYFLGNLKSIFEENHYDKIASTKLQDNEQKLVLSWNNSKKQLANFISIIRAENRGDVIFPIVSAASIVAKVYRDKEIRKIEQEYHLPLNSLASGYANERLEPFMQQYANEIRKRTVFPFIRYEWDWKPLQEIFTAKNSTLINFL